MNNGTISGYIKRHSRSGTVKSEMKAALPRLEPDKLPIEFTFPGLDNIRIRAETYNENHWSMLHPHLQDSTDSGSGLSQESVMSMDEKYEPTKQGHGRIIFINATDGNFIAVMTVKPANMCRSESPLYCGGFFLVNRAYRGQKILFYMLQLYPVYAQHFGYKGSLTKAAVVARSLVSIMRSGGGFLGIVPWSIQLKGIGWCHDVIMHLKFHGSTTLVAKEVTLPDLCSKEVLEAAHPAFKRQAFTHNLPVIQHKEFGKLKISLAVNKDDLWEVQHILRKCALKGEGFGLDEFTTDGVFNEKLIDNCCYWAVRKEEDGTMLAVVMTGEAVHPRSRSKDVVNGMIMVLKPFRRQGLGSQIMQLCEEYCQKSGAQQILTDVLASDVQGLGLMEKHGFRVTGTVPNSCITKRGSKFVYVNSNIYWKPLLSGPPSARL